MVVLRKMNVFGGEQAESVIGVLNSLEGFREVTEFTLKVYLRMESKIHVCLSENQCVR